MDRDGIRFGLIRDVANRVSASVARYAGADCRLVQGSVTVMLVEDPSKR